MKQPKPKILIACHRHLYSPHRGGGETSMAIIAEYLQGEGFDVACWVNPHTTGKSRSGILFLGGALENLIAGADAVLSWGSTAFQAYTYCRRFSKPFILSVRWWRNVVDVSGMIGDLSRRSRERWHDTRQPMFDYAAAVITNNNYSAGIIERFYNRKALVSYVPIPGQATRAGKANGAIVAISPNKGIGERRALLDIEAHLPQGEKMIIVNAQQRQYHRTKIEVVPYMQNLNDIWRRAKVFIQPIYGNDICGTLRTTIEAQQHGVPVIANARCGLDEKVPAGNLVPYSASTREWVEKIREVSQDWQARSEEALDVFQQYDTPAQLGIFKREIEKALKVKNTAL